MKRQTTLVATAISSSWAAGLRSLYPGSNKPVQCGEVKCHPSEVCHSAKGCIDPSECGINDSMCMFEHLDQTNKQCMQAVVDCFQECDPELGCIASPSSKPTLAPTRTAQKK